jgi:hypothetical protein
MCKQIASCGNGPPEVRGTLMEVCQQKPAENATAYADR